MMKERQEPSLEDDFCTLFRYLEPKIVPILANDLTRRKPGVSHLHSHTQER